MRIHRNGLTGLVVWLAVVGLPRAQAEDKRDVAVEPTDWGHVCGVVYDAHNEGPLAGATVVVQNDGEFATEGRTVVKTNKMGQYVVAGAIGRVTSSLDLGRLLTTSLLGAVFGGASKKTRRVDVNRLNMRVSCDGYHPFEGAVVCKDVDAEKFRVDMVPILLTRKDSTEVPTIAEGWGPVRILELSITPEIARPRQPVTARARIQCPPVTSVKELSVVTDWWERWTNWSRKGLNFEKQEGDVLVVSRQFAAPDRKTGAPYIADVSVDFEKCPYDAVVGGRFAGALFQTVTTDQQEQAARLRLEAYREADPKAKQAKLKELCARPEVVAEDCAGLAETSKQLNDTDTAVKAYAQAISLLPEKDRLRYMGPHANALVDSGKPESVLSEYVAWMGKIGEKDRPKHVPAALVAAIGRAYLATGKDDLAEQTNTDLARWPNSSTDPSVGQFRRALRQTQVAAAVKKDPDNPQAWVDYGRFLMDQGQWEEAIAKLQKAVGIDPNLPTVAGDLAYAVLHLRAETPQASQDLDRAIAQAETEAGAGAAQKPSTDFRSWHKYGILLYAKGWQQQRSADAAFEQTFARSREALRTALKCGRTGAEVDRGRYGAFGYTSAKVVAIAGFAYPEANSDFLLLDSLRTLQSHPADYLAYFNMATALLDLGQFRPAAEAVAKCLELKPDCVEAKFVRGLVDARLGEVEAATKNLSEVARLNPRHGKANLELARLYAEAGDNAKAAAHEAAHRKFWESGVVPPPSPTPAPADGVPAQTLGQSPKAVTPAGVQTSPQNLSQAPNGSLSPGEPTQGAPGVKKTDGPAQATIAVPDEGAIVASVDGEDIWLLLGQQCRPAVGDSFRVVVGTKQITGPGGVVIHEEETTAELAVLAVWPAADGKPPHAQCSAKVPTDLGRVKQSQPATLRTKALPPPPEPPKPVVPPPHGALVDTVEHGAVWLILGADCRADVGDRLSVEGADRQVVAVVDAVEDRTAGGGKRAKCAVGTPDELGLLKAGQPASLMPRPPTKKTVVVLLAEVRGRTPQPEKPKPGTPQAQDALTRAVASAHEEARRLIREQYGIEPAVERVREITTVIAGRHGWNAQAKTYDVVVRVDGTVEGELVDKEGRR